MFRCAIPLIVFAQFSYGLFFIADELEAQDEQQRNAAVLQGIRAALASRDLPMAKKKLAEAAKINGDDAFAVERDRLDLLHRYVAEFWKSVDEGGKTLPPASDLVIGETRVAVVEYSSGRLVLRVAGQNRRYTLKDMPAKVVLTLAERVLKRDSPANKVYFGAFLAMDSRGSRKMAAEYWTAAQAAGIDVASLLPELDVTPAATANIEIPAMTVAARRLLSPKSWNLRQKTGNRITRKALGELASTNKDGRLQIVVPKTFNEHVQIVYSRRFTGSFGCRAIFEGVPKGQSFGLFAADTRGESIAVPLPEGTVKVEFARQGSSFVCLINDKKVEVEPSGETAPRMAGNVGFTLPIGHNVVLAWFEMRGR